MSIELIVIALFLVLIAASIHGALGFGFPMLSTPILTLVYDLKTAVLLTLLPSLAIIIVSLLNCSNLQKLIVKFRLIIVTTTVGSFLGSWVLIWADPNILKLLLASTICVYLFSSKIKIFSVFLINYPLLFAIIMGSLAGIIGGATNAIAPILMIYLLEVTKSAKQVIVVSNICFLLGKLMQLTVLSTHYSINDIVISELMLVFIIAIIGLFIGIKLQSKINDKSYHTLIKAGQDHEIYFIVKV
jgi:uncharacterized membrane protein YfcA